MPRAAGAYRVTLEISAGSVIADRAQAWKGTIDMPRPRAESVTCVMPRGR